MTAKDCSSFVYVSKSTSYFNPCTSSPLFVRVWTRPQCNAHLTLADPTPRLVSDAIGGESGQNHPTSRRDPIHIGRMARNAYIRIGWYGERTVTESYLLQLPLKDTCIVHVRLPIGRQRRAILNMFNIGRRPPDEAPTADSGSGMHSHWPSWQHRGVRSANVKRA